MLIFQIRYRLTLDNSEHKEEVTMPDNHRFRDKKNQLKRIRRDLTDSYTVNGFELCSVTRVYGINKLRKKELLKVIWYEGKVYG